MNRKFVLIIAIKHRVVFTLLYVLNSVFLITEPLSWITGLLKLQEADEKTSLKQSERDHWADYGVKAEWRDSNELFTIQKLKVGTQAQLRTYSKRHGEKKWNDEARKEGARKHPEGLPMNNECCFYILLSASDIPVSPSFLFCAASVHAC